MARRYFFSAFLLLTIPAVVISSVQSLSYIKTEFGKYRNMPPSTQVQDWTLTHRHRRFASDYENEEVQCEVFKTQLNGFKNGLQAVLNAIHESNQANRSSIFLSGSAPRRTNSLDTSRGCAFHLGIAATAQEIHEILGVLAQVQQRGELYYQTLRQNQSDEINHTNQKFTLLLQNKENDLNLFNSQLLDKIESAKKETEAGEQSHESFKLIKKRRWEIEQKFNASLCPKKLVYKLWSREIPKEIINEISPVVSKPNCSVISSHLLETIQGLADESTRLIIEISRNNFPPKFQSNSLPGIVSPDDCRPLLKRTNSAIQQLKRIKNYIPADLLRNNQNRIAQAQKSHDDHLAILKGHFDQSNHDLDAKYRGDRMNLQSQFQILHQNLARITRQNLDSEHEEIIKSRQLAAYLVDCGQTAPALSTLAQFYTGLSHIDPSVLFSELRQGIDLYPTNIDEFETMIFGYKQDTFSATNPGEQTVQRHEAVFQNLNKSSPSILTLNILVQNLLRNCSPAQDSTGTGTRMCPKSDRLATLQAETKMAADEVMTTWVENIIQGRYEPILNYLQKTMGAQETMLYYFPQLVNTAYAKQGVISTKNLLEFSAAIAMPSIKASVYLQIFELMQAHHDINNRPEICMLALRVKNELATFTNSDDRGKLESIQQALPDSIRRLVFNPAGYVILESKEHLGYTLYASSYGNIYTYPSNNYPGGKNQMWKVHPIENGRYFSLENVQNGKVLFEATGKRVKGESGLSLTSIKQHWEVVPVNNGSTAVFRNRQTGNYLSGGYLGDDGASRSRKSTSPQTFENRYSANQEWNIIDDS